MKPKMICCRDSRNRGFLFHCPAGQSRGRQLVLETLENRRLLSSVVTESGGLNQESVLAESALPDHVVRAAYIVPSNRTAQQSQIEGVQAALQWYRDWYSDQMDRYGFGPKTFEYETESDGVMPKIHVVDVPEEDSYFHQDQWSRVSTAASAAGIPIWQAGQIWIETYEAMTIEPDGTIIGGTALGGGWGTGSGAGVAMFGASPVLHPDCLVDDTAYEGTVFPELGPYALKNEQSFPWFEGSTFSSIASSHYGAICHEMGHAFGLAHDSRNDGNFNGNLMGNGLRGFRGWAASEQYTTDDLRLSYAAALAMNASRYFNGDRVYTDNTAPDVSVETSGNVDLTNGQVAIQFSATDPSGLSCAILLHNGDMVAEIPLDGDSVSATLSTWIYEPGEENTFTISVYDTQGNQRQEPVTVTPAAGFNRAPQPFLYVEQSIVWAGETIVFDATRSTDPDDDTKDLLVEWDLDGNGVFDTNPTSEKTISTSFDEAGSAVIRVRVTDPSGAQSVSSPVAMRILANSIPIADAGGPYTVVEGLTIDLDASGSTDVDQDSTTLIYQWDFDGDGEYDDATGISPTFSTAGLSGPTTVMAGLLVTDSHGATDSSTTSIAITSEGSEPTAYEQYLLELINRGRLDPSAEAARYGIDLNADLTAGTISTDTKQPLAFSPVLISAARAHSDWILAADTFSHTGEGGSSPSDRMAAGGYPLVPPWGWAENIAAQGTYATTQTAQDVDAIHAMLYGSSGHRANQLNGSFREVGLGLAQGKFTPTNPSPTSLVATEDFAYSGTTVFLTGVVYDDRAVLANQFYTPGEGLGGVTIEATRLSDNQVFVTQTWASGGYTLALPSGEYTVVASGDALGNAVTRHGVTIQTENVKVDFTPRDNTPPVVVTLTAAPDPVARSGNLTLTAGGVSDSDGSVARVEFYRGQTLLGADENGTDGWSLTISTAGWPLGEQTLSALAQDNNQAWSDPASTAVTVTGTATDLGVVDFRTFTGLDLSPGSLYYSLRTSHDGFLSVEVVAPKPPKSARARLYSQNPEENPSAVPLVSSELVDVNQRLDWTVEAGQTYYVEFYGASSAFDARIANLVHRNGTTVTVFGTDNDDQFVFNAAGSREISINGTAYLFSDTEVGRVEFDGGQGRDRVELRDSVGDESLEAWATQATFVNSSTDSIPDFTVSASNFEELQAYANSGGEDSAVLYGSAYKDKFKAEPAENYAKMYGGRMYNRVKFFDQVEAYGGGGKDLARLFDTKSDETFEGMMGLSRFAGNGFEIDMHDFVQVIAYATAGGNDTATLTDSARKDEFHGKSHKCEMFDRATDGDVYKITVRAFDVVHAHATDQTAGTGGSDIAKLWGTVLDDYLEAAEDWLSYGIRRPELDPLYDILAFETVKIRETPGGTDQANLSDNLGFELMFDGEWEMV